MDTIGDRIKEARKAIKMTQDALATKSGVSQGLIGQIESGKNQGTKHINEIAKALGVSVDWLDKGAGQMQPLATIGANRPASWPFKNIDVQRFLNISAEDLSKIEGTIDDMLTAAQIRYAKQTQIKSA